MTVNPRRLETTPLLHPGLCSFGPWPRSHWGWLAVFNVVGLLLIIVTWYRTSGTGSIPNQLGWVNLGLGGLVVAGVGNALWLLRGRRGVALARLVVVPDAHIAVPVAELAKTNGQDEVLLVSGPRMSLYHRSDCLLMAGKEGHIASRPEHERAGLRRCEVCEP